MFGARNPIRTKIIYHGLHHLNSSHWFGYKKQKNTGSNMVRKYYGNNLFVDLEDPTDLAHNLTYEAEMNRIIDFYKLEIENNLICYNILKKKADSVELENFKLKTENDQLNLQIERLKIKLEDQKQEEIRKLKNHINILECTQKNDKITIENYSNENNELKQRNSDLVSEFKRLNEEASPELRKLLAKRFTINLGGELKILM